MTMMMIIMIIFKFLISCAPVLLSSELMFYINIYFLISYYVKSSNLILSFLFLIFHQISILFVGRF